MRDNWYHKKERSSKKKVIKTVFELIAYIIITTGYIAYYSLKGLFVCPIIVKIGILFSYAVMGISYHYNK